MSHSKVDEGDERAREGRGTAQLVQMMRSGRSFSGREPHCAFLNEGLPAGSRGRGGDEAAPAPRFADVSAVSGLGLPEDGRALAVTDWDRDGDLDLWITNRTAPQLRFLRNDAGAEADWLELALEGDGVSVNRDAIGARVEVVLASGERLVRSLRAGEGFLSQSSKWLHFGLGRPASGPHGPEAAAIAAIAAIAEVVVRWPAGPTESYHGLEPRGRYLLRQGSARAERRGPEPPAALPARALALPAESSSSRSALAWRLPVPRVPYRDLVFGDPKQRATGGGGPLLVNLWASWCAPCIAELRAFEARADELRAAGVDVLALSVDGLGGRAGDPEAAARALEGFSFEAGRATPELLELVQMLYAAQFKLNLELVVPTSFLIDARGRLAAVYRGPVEVGTLLADAASVEGPRPERLRRAAGAAGTALADPVVLDAGVRLELSTRLGVAQAMIFNERFPEAIAHYQGILELAPRSVDALYGLGSVLVRVGRFADGIEALRRVLDVDPEHADALTRLGTAYLRMGDRSRAEAHYARALAVDPTHERARANLARLRAESGAGGAPSPGPRR